MFVQKDTSQIVTVIPFAHMTSGTLRLNAVRFSYTATALFQVESGSKTFYTRLHLFSCLGLLAMAR